LTEWLVRPALRAIREAIEGVEGAVRGKTLDDFSADWLLRHGVQRGVEIVSEATRRIPPELQARQPNIPWAQIMGIGNVLRARVSSGLRHPDLERRARAFSALESRRRGD
jgi:uncharacterized protein with HEPN domain